MADRVDGLLRALTEDQCFRIVMADTTRTVIGCAEAQQAHEEMAQVLGELVTGTILFRELMAPTYRVQALLKDPASKTTLVADSHPSGATRALIQGAEGKKHERLGPGAMLQLMRSLPNGEINQGVVEVPESGSLSDAFQAYMVNSEQVTTTAVLGAALGDEGILAAGGFMVQLLPGANQEGIRRMVSRLERFGPIDAYLIDPLFTPQWLMGELLRDIPHTLVGTGDVRCECWCSEERMLGALATLNRTEIEGLVAQGEPLDIACDYCHRDFHLPVSRLVGLLGKN